MIHDNHKLDEERGALYDFTDLLAIRLKGDNQLESFMTTWESVLSAMAHPPSPNIIEVLFLEQLRHSSALRDEIASTIAQGKALTSVPTPSWLRP